MSESNHLPAVVDYPPATPGGYPRPLDDAAFHGPAGAAVRTVAPHSEADPAVLLLRLLSALGCMIGRGPHVDIDGIEHAARLWLIVAGSTGSGRKGQSWGSGRRLLKMADPDFNARIASGLTTGQGLVHAIRDPLRGKAVSKPQKAEAEESEDGLCELDAGVSDKRLLVREAEFAKVLAAAGREGNNLSATLRSAWDGETLRELTRTNPYAATDPHVVVQADVTPAELRDMLGATDKANGFANRFLFVASRRSKLLPFGGRLDDDDLKDHAAELRAAVDAARLVGRMTWTAEARPVWSDLYARMNAGAGDDGTLGMLLARGPTHVLRLSITYALLDGSDAIGPQHIAAAVAVWRYVADSTAWAFGECGAAADPDAVLLDWTRGRNPTAAEVGRSGPRHYRGNAEAAELALRDLAKRGHGTYAPDPEHPGRPTERFTPADAGYGYETPQKPAVPGGSISVSTPAPPETSPPPASLNGHAEARKRAPAARVKGVL